MKTDKGPTAGGLLREGEALLTSAGVGEAGLNCGWLLAEVLKADRLSLLADPGRTVSQEDAGKFGGLLARKAAGEPLAYILGYQPFCGLKLRVDRRVLVPRPETEELVDLASEFLRRSGREKARILDFGTGSGAIALALASRFPLAEVTAADTSPRALACARLNAVELGLEGRVKFLRASSVGASGGPFGLIVSNPPYIPTGVIPGLDREVRAEPRVALDGGADGLDVASRVIAEAPAALESGGALFMELGDSQAESALALLSGKVWSSRGVIKDFDGKRRFLSAVKS